MTANLKTLNQLTIEVMNELYKNFGPTDTLRFLSQFYSGTGNYTEERKELFKDFSIEEYKNELNSLS
jgi:hypothetical protein